MTRHNNRFWHPDLELGTKGHLITQTPTGRLLARMGPWWQQKDNRWITGSIRSDRTQKTTAPNHYIIQRLPTWSHHYRCTNRSSVSKISFQTTSKKSHKGNKITVSNTQTKLQNKHAKHETYKFTQKVRQSENISQPINHQEIAGKLQARSNTNNLSRKNRVQMSKIWDRTRSWNSQEKYTVSKPITPGPNQNTIKHAAVP